MFYVNNQIKQNKNKWNNTLTVMYTSTNIMTFSGLNNGALVLVQQKRR